jgi:ADP-ribosyl-[dinitrogen reductase] hydrolase
VTRQPFRAQRFSDDTEHCCMIAEALIVSAGEPDRFLQSFAGRLRWWLFSFPPAMGLATLHALLKLWAGFPPDKSGVFFAGNGPAMRSAILGVCYGDDPRAIEQMMSSNRLKPYLTVRAVQGLEGMESLHRSKLVFHCSHHSNSTGPSHALPM